MTNRVLSLKPQYPFFLANQPVMGQEFLPVIDKFSQNPIAQVSVATPEDIEKGISLACQAAPVLAKMSSYERRDILEFCVLKFKEQEKEFAELLCLEVGKPIKDARIEVARFIDTFRIAAEEVGRLYGEIMPLDRTARGKNYQGFSKRFPIGPCSFISPFNFPLNLTAHKIAPALAVGCPFVLKPATRTPLTALKIGEILSGASLPSGAFSILPCPRNGADLFTSDDRIKLLSFTGSPSVGWDLRAKAGKKKVVLELGGNAACIVDETAHVDDCVQRILIGAFSQSGQSCISVQRILIHKTIYSEVREKLIKATQLLRSGDPKSESTDIGPLISETDANRLESWIHQAQKRGASVLCGGKRTGAVLDATLLENVPVDEPLCAEEAFGPVAVITSFSSFSECLQVANNSRFGLQAGVFTQNIDHALKAWNELEVGGVIINDIPSWRADCMPYGGVKDSGMGREGVRFAMEDMTEPRLMVVRSLS
ncbi:MAG: aldehyde dehydrogenase family protein [Proteobacteria bacterium]|nr:aldehyde dehydrogenase family protein [Pseudomonadota bacterium]NDC23957.1 aldehyde dehydrogenase family protein [Pseudomonadota bacterium]NDD03996.1 aldehyde dehydrogenase family protein [Pseudomonadota bacterium]NDG26905.1 aldehyde dehydrogenase family protein [Pseudomonadota bacterium]